MKSKITDKGFTLIELLLVVSIIGLLSSIIMVSFTQARMHARDAKRMLDFDAMQKALELYFADNGKYPAVTSSGDYPRYTKAYDYYPNEWNELATALKPYMVGLSKSIPSSLPYIYVTGGTQDVCLSYYGGQGAGYSKIWKSQTGYVLLTQFEGGDWLASEDGGVFLYAYERYGGDFVLGSC